MSGLLLLGALSHVQAGAAQAVVQGLLLEAGTEQPVILAMVALTDTAYGIVEQTLTDHEGAFRLNAPEPGHYYVVVHRIGYEVSIDGILELEEGGFIEVTFYIQPRPVEVEGITASVERVRTERYLDRQGFYDRRKSGFGYFIDPEELERRHPVDTQDLLHRAPGIDVIDNGFAGESVRCLSIGQGEGSPIVYVDGVRVAFPDVRASDGPDVDLDGLVGVENMAAVEVYSRTSQVPLEYGGTNAACVILVWTKH